MHNKKENPNLVLLDWIFKNCEAVDKTVSEVAVEVGIAASSMSHFRNAKGKRTLKFETVYRLAECFGTAPPSPVQPPVAQAYTMDDINNVILNHGIKGLLTIRQTKPSGASTNGVGALSPANFLLENDGVVYICSTTKTYADCPLCLCYSNGEASIIPSETAENVVSYVIGEVKCY